MDALALNLRALTWLGQQLRQAREDQGISLEQIAGTTHISLGLLRALEQGEGSSLPEPVYVQGFIRKYAHRVGLDFDSLMAEAQVQGSEAVPVAESKSWLWWQRSTPSPASSPGTMPSEPPLSPELTPTAGSPSAPARPSLHYPLLGGILLLSSLAMIWTWRQSQPTAPISTVTLASPPPPPAAALKPESEAPPAPAQSTAKAVKAEAAAGTPATIEAKGPVWLEVWVDGKPQPGQLLKSGQQLKFQVRQALRIYPGRPDLVTVQWGDRRVSPLGPIETIRWFEFSTPPSPVQKTAPTPSP